MLFDVKGTIFCMLRACKINTLRLAENLVYTTS